jgi:hypothetical protein
LVEADVAKGLLAFKLESEENEHCKDNNDETENSDGNADNKDTDLYSVSKCATTVEKANSGRDMLLI